MRLLPWFFCRDSAEDAGEFLVRRSQREYGPFGCGESLLGKGELLQRVFSDTILLQFFARCGTEVRRMGFFRRFHILDRCGEGVGERV